MSYIARRSLDYSKHFGVSYEAIGEHLDIFCIADRVFRSAQERGFPQGCGFVPGLGFPVSYLPEQSVDADPLSYPDISFLSCAFPCLFRWRIFYRRHTDSV
ncbi:hypothetical protein PoB_006065800 [Plakobranchus ocellatus]|uniref:Uncharacterized protein n=1 Tax=Plakobranchus ocellatus TaxID=259542 RepID=A0AAV4CQI5_9GAST|nr:hypothetical protein PoB_006065800 [Plakobranchus ocellatus]